VSWLPDDFFIGAPTPQPPRAIRPIGQGDVFTEIPVAGRTGLRNGQPGLKAKTENVIVVASSCGMRKQAGDFNDVIHVAPIKRMASLAPGWGSPWEGWLHVLPLPGLVIGDETDLGANLSRIGLCGGDMLSPDRRVASVSLDGMRALKARLAMYFVRSEVPDGIVGVGAHEEWYELDLWERWTAATGSEEGFQAWLDEENPNYRGRSRRETLYDDLVGIRQQLEDATA
jgi:hypothetical protein